MPRARVFQLATLYLLLVCAIGLLNPIRNALALHGVGAGGFYKVYLASAATVLFLVPFGRIATRVPQHLLTPGLALFFALNLLLFRPLFPGGASAGIVFYAWHDLYASILVSQFFLATQGLLDSRSAKSAYPFIIAGGSIGATLGGAITGFLAASLGVANLLLVAAALTAAFAIALPLVTRAHARSPAPASLRPHQSANALSWREVVNDRQLQLITASVLLTILVKQIIDYRFNVLSATSFGSPEAVSAFQGKFNAATQWLPLVAAGLLQPLLARWGVAAALFMLPAAMLATNVMAGLWTGLAAAVTAKAAEVTVRNSAERTGREIVYLPVSAAVKARAKPVIDVGVESLGKALAAGAILLVLVLVGAKGLAWVAAAVSLVWLTVAWGLRRGYVRALARAIATRDTTLDVLAASLAGSQRLADVQAELGSGDPDRAAFAVDLLDRTQPKAPTQHGRNVSKLAAVLRDRSAELIARRAAAHALGHLEDPRAVAALLNCVGGSDGVPPEPDSRLRRKALAALSRLHRRAPGLPIDEFVAMAALEHDLVAAARYRNATPTLPTGLLHRAVGDAWQRRRENVFRDLGLLYPPAVMDGCYRALVSETPQRHDAARDLIEEGLPRGLSNRLEPVLPGSSPATPVADGAAQHIVTALASDADPWVRHCAMAATRTDYSGSDPMDLIDKVFLLQRVDVFQEARSDHLALLAGIAQEVDADAGAVLIRKDDIPDALYVIVRGEVTLDVPGRPPWPAKQGEGLGALFLVSERPAGFTATAASTSTLLRITRSDLEDLLVDSPEIAVALLRGMAHRVTSLLGRLSTSAPLAEV